MKDINLIKDVNSMNRREFLASAAGLAAMATVANAQQTAPATAPADPAAAAPPTPAPAGRGGRGGATTPAGSITYNTVLTKLRAGKQVFSNTIEQPDLDAAKKACEGQDFIWIEMQHSLLTWRETQQLVKVIAAESCIPFIRVPGPNEGDLQKATDSGALGVIIPMVYAMDHARNAILFSKYPVGNLQNPNTKPWGHRSVGSNQATSIWGRDYLVNANNNVAVMIQIENPAGVGMIDNILDEVEGIDIVMVASNDFGQQAGDRDGSVSYNAREKLVRESVLAHGKFLAGPSNWQDRPGYKLFQGRRNANNNGYDANGNRI